MDPIRKLSDEQLRAIAADLQVQLERGTGTRPVLWMLAQARERAGKALVMFIDADAEDPKLIRQLQAEVKLYDDMVNACRQLIRRGKEADARIRESDRAAMDEVVMEMTEDERRLHGLEPRGID